MFSDICFLCSPVFTKLAFKGLLSCVRSLMCSDVALVVSRVIALLALKAFCFLLPSGLAPGSTCLCVETNKQQEK
jgi:hypothetical protein